MIEALLESKFSSDLGVVSQSEGFSPLDNTGTNYTQYEYEGRVSNS